jgi:hypothetical protein
MSFFSCQEHNAIAQTWQIASRAPLAIWLSAADGDVGAGSSKLRGGKKGSSRDVPD